MDGFLGQYAIFSPFVYLRHILTLKEVRIMRNQYEANECIAVIGSMTRALRAQNVLAAAAIRTEVIKPDSLPDAKGCVYALSYPCRMDGNVKRVLSDAGIRVRSYHTNGYDLS